MGLGTCSIVCFRTGQLIPRNELLKTPTGDAPPPPNVLRQACKRRGSQHRLHLFLVVFVCVRASECVSVCVCECVCVCVYVCACCCVLALWLWIASHAPIGVLLCKQVPNQFGRFVGLGVIGFFARCVASWAGLQSRNPVHGLLLDSVLPQ